MHSVLYESKPAIVHEPVSSGCSYDDALRMDQGLMETSDLRPSNGASHLLKAPYSETVLKSMQVCRQLCQANPKPTAASKRQHFGRDPLALPWADGSDNYGSPISLGER